MKTVIKMCLLAFLFYVQPLYAAAPQTVEQSQSQKNYFQFQIGQYHTSRQAGQTINLYVRYAYKKGLAYDDYPDYRALRKVALAYLEPSADLPENTFWEIIAAKLGDSLMSQFPIEAISVQLQVFPNEGGGIYEPGFHGAIYTRGKISPLNVSPPVLAKTK